MATLTANRPSPSAPGLTLRQVEANYCVDFEQRIAEGFAAPQTLCTVKLRMRRVLAKLGDKPVRAIQLPEIIALLHTLKRAKRRVRARRPGYHMRVTAQPLEESYIRGILGTLQTVLTYAKKLRLIEQNPACNPRLIRRALQATNKKPHAPRTPAKSLTPDEKAAVMPVLTNMIADGPRMRVIAMALIVMIETGLRVSEAVPLRWKDLDVGGHVFEGQPTLYVQRAWKQLINQLGRPKSGKKRRINLSQILQGLLRPMEDIAQVDPDGWVFPYARSRHGFLPPSVLAKHLARVLKKAGIKRAVSLHGLRRTYATLERTQSNRPLPWIQRQLGHRYASTTLKYVDHRPAGSTQVVEWAPATQLNPACGRTAPPPCPPALLRPARPA